jgi:Growth-arrest specific micro-tubule binding
VRCCAVLFTTYVSSPTAGLKSMLLEKKLEAMHEQLELKEAQLGEVLAAANLDPMTLQQVRQNIFAD